MRETLIEFGESLVLMIVGWYLISIMGWIVQMVMEV